MSLPMLRAPSMLLGLALWSLPLAGEAAYFLRLAVEATPLVDEVAYRIDTGPGSSFETVLADPQEWELQGDTPFAPPRDSIRVWAKFDLPVVEEPSQVIVVAGPWERIEYYIIRDGELAARHLAGSLVPWEERSSHVTGASPYFTSGLVPVDLLPGSHTSVLARMATDHRLWKPDAIRFRIWDATVVRAGELRDRLILGAFTGITLFLVVFNLTLFALHRDQPGYLYLALSLALGSIVTGSVYGGTYELLWPNHPAWDTYMLWLGIPLASWSFSRYARRYMSMAGTMPFADRLLEYLERVALVMIPAFFLPVVMGTGNTSFDLYIIAGFVSVAAPVFLGIGIAALVQRHPRGHAFMTSMLSVSVGSAITVAGFAGLLSAGDLVLHAGQIGWVLLGVQMSTSQVYQVQNLQRELVERQLASAQLQNTHEREKRELIEAQSRDLEDRIRERTAELAATKEKSEALLANILPAAIIGELKDTGTSEPRRHDEVSILFTDFAGFTQAVSTIPARRLVRELDEIFRSFDDIVRHHGLEKIKTIGDAYMAAAGLPVEVPDHAARCVRAALDLARCMDARNETAALKWRLRIGVHSGSVVAGIVGKDKFAYDVWGDTVNIASRLESAGDVGRVNISAYTFELVQEEFVCEYRGKVMAKGKGELDMYFVTGPKTRAETL